MFQKSDESHPTSPASNTPVLDYWTNVRRATRSWARSTFNRDSVVSSLKSLAWVAPLSALIWIYAEQTQRVERPRQPIPFQVKTTDPRQVVSILFPPDQMISADLHGPRLALDQLVSKLIPTDNHPGAVILLTNAVAGKKYDITASRIRDSEVFRDSGVLVSEETPATLSIYVDTLVDQDVDVQPPQGMENFTSPPVFEPKTVRVTIPKQQLDELQRTNERLTAYADFSRFDELRTPGPHALTNVPIQLNSILRDNPHVTISPVRVSASVDIKNTERELKIDSVPIFVVGPPTTLDTYKVKLVDRQFIPNVVISGPRDVIDQIENNTYEPRPKMVLEVTNDDIGPTPKTRQLRFDPPGVVKVISPPANERTVTFTLVERGAGE